MRKGGKEGHFSGVVQIGFEEADDVGARFHGELFADGGAAFLDGIDAQAGEGGDGFGFDAGTHEAAEFDFLFVQVGVSGCQPGAETVVHQVHGVADFFGMVGSLIGEHVVEALQEVKVPV